MALVGVLFVYDPTAGVAQAVGDLFGWRTVAAEDVAHVCLGLLVAGHVREVSVEIEKNKSHGDIALLVHI